MGGENAVTRIDAWMLIAPGLNGKGRRKKEDRNV